MDTPFNGRWPGVGRLTGRWPGPGVVGQSGAAFNPATFSAVKLWLDAGSVTGVADGGAMAAADWADKSSFLKGALAARNNLTYRADAGNGKPAVEFNGTDSYAKSPSFSISQPFREFVVAKWITWASGHTLTDGGGGSQALLQQTAITPKHGIFAGTSTLCLESTHRMALIGLIDATYNGASSSNRVSGNQLVTGSPGAGGRTGGMVLGGRGGLNAGFFANAQVLDYIVCDSTLTAGQALYIRSGLIAKHGIVTQSFLVGDGNSLMAGYLNSAGEDPISVAQGLLGGTALWRTLSTAANGKQTTAITAAAATLAANKATYTKEVVIEWEGTNDLLLNGNGGGSYAATCLSNLVAMYAAAKTTNTWPLVIGATIPAAANDGLNGWSAQNTADRLTVNADLRLNYASYGIDYLIDWDDDARFLDPTNSTYFHPDRIHWKAVLAAVAGAKIATAIHALTDAL